MSAHHAHAPGHGKPPYAIVLAITAAYGLIELAGGLWTGSLALLSDAGHMFSDVLALALAAAAARLAQRPVGYRHTYGWARAEVIGALINGLLMLGVIVFIVTEAISRLNQPRPVAATEMLLIALVGLIVNGGVAWLLSRGERTVGSRGALLHVMGDLVSSIAAVVAAVTIQATGWSPIDPILSLVIAGLILASTLRLLRDTLHVLMEGVPPALEIPAIGRALAGLPGVVSVHDLHVWSIAPEQVALSAHLQVDDLRQWPDILSAATGLLHNRYGIGHVTLQPEVGRGTTDTRASVIRLWPRNTRPPSGIS